MTTKFLRATATAAVALALTAGAAAPSAFAGESTLGERNFLSYGVTNGDDTKNANTADRYLRGSGASSGTVNVDREKAEAATPVQPENDKGRYLRGSGISSGPVPSQQ